MLRFISVYLIIIISILSFYISDFNKNSKQLEITNNELSGMVYIQVVYHLGIDLVELKNLEILGSDADRIKNLKDDITLDIDAMFSMQDYFNNFKDEEFNSALEKIKKFDYSEDEYYDFLDSINHENYRIGDVSRLLFEEDREIYFLSSLLTHYMPEYIISLLLSDSFIQEFYYNAKLSDKKKNLYIEQNKLVYLSSEEIFEIINSLAKTQETKILLGIINSIHDKLKEQGKYKTSLQKWELDKDELKKYLEISKDMIEKSIDLNDHYISILANKLDSRKSNIENKMLKNTALLIFTIFLITAVSIYFYRVKALNLTKEEEINKINNELDQIALFSKTDIHGNITHISSALLKLSGHTRKEVIGKNHNIFKHEDNDRSIYKNMWRTILNKETWRGELKNKRKDGSSFWIDLTIVPEIDKHGNIISFSANRKDITDNKVLEEEKLKTQEALTFRSKFLSNMSHEIRTPLNGIIGLTNVMKKTQLDDKQKDIVENITSSSEILLGIINDILDISKIEAGKMSIEKAPFNLEKLIHTLESIMNVKAEQKGIYLEKNYNNFQTFNFLGDALRISQVLNNLISNAIKFTHNGGITLNISMKKNSRIVFEIKDTGIGLKSEIVEHLFEEFTQADMDTSRKYGGTGLGLSISKHLVKLMGGEIWVHSIFGKGSSFYFEIPIEVDTTSREDYKDTKEDIKALESTINQLKSRKILVAEDNKMNQMVLSMLLEESSIELDFADDGLEALEMYEPKIYDLIMMDIQMPNMNGYEATKEIRKIDKNTPIIALSANVMQEDIQKTKDVGMDDYLAKPIELEKLYRALIKYLK